MVTRQEDGEPPAATTAAAGGKGEREEATVSRRDFFGYVATSTFGAAAVLGAVLAPQEASANGMLDYPPARLNNRCVWSCACGLGGKRTEYNSRRTYTAAVQDTYYT